MRISSAPACLLFGLVLALALSVRLLAPAGFMPAFDHGAVIIVPCPAADANAPAMHHHGGKTFHQPCPYAAAASTGTLDTMPDLLEPLAFFAAALLLGRTFLFIERATARERPPLRGPPSLA